MDTRQTEKITQKYEEQPKEQKQKFEQELQARLQDTKETIDEALDYDAIMKEMEADYKSKDNHHSQSLDVLIRTSKFFYGAVAIFYVGGLLAIDSYDSYGIIPFITVVTLALVPLYLRVRSADRDKARALALREDARSKRALTILTTYYERSEGESNQALLRLFDHHTHSGTAALILGTSKEQPANVVQAVAKTLDRRSEDKKGGNK